MFVKLEQAFLGFKMNNKVYKFSKFCYKIEKLKLQNKSILEWRVSFLTSPLWWQAAKEVSCFLAQLQKASDKLLMGTRADDFCVIHNLSLRLAPLRIY